MLQLEDQILFVKPRVAPAVELLESLAGQSNPIHAVTPRPLTATHKAMHLLVTE